MQPRAGHALLVLALASLAAGCLAPAADSPAPAGIVDDLADAAPTGSVAHRSGARLLEGVSGIPAVGGQYSIGAGSTEPTIATTSSGAVFTDGFATSVTGRRQPTVFRSLDAGQTWEDVGPTIPTGDHLPPTTNDPIVYVDPATDRVFWLNQLGTACADLFFSDDDGESWLGTPIACGTPIVDHVTIVAAAPRVVTTAGYPNVVYICSNYVYATSCASSLNGGLTFGPSVLVYPGVDPASEQTFCGGIHSLPRAGADGRVYVAKNQCDVPSVAVTEDDGLTWTVHAIPTEQVPYGTQVHVAIDEADNLYVVWTGSEDGLVWLTSSTDSGATWREPLMVASPGVTAADLPSVAAGAAGKVSVAYVGTTVHGGYEGKPAGNPGLAGDILGQPEAPEWANATWNGYIAVIEDALAEELAIQTVTANDPADPIARGLCGRTRCHGMNDFIDSTVDATGRPWVAFVDVCTEECATDEKVLSGPAIGFAGTLVRGPALRGEAAELAEIAPPPVAAEADAAADPALLDIVRRAAAKTS